MVSSAFGPLPQKDIDGDAHTFESHPSTAVPTSFTQLSIAEEHRQPLCLRCFLHPGQVPPCVIALYNYQNARLLPQSEAL